MGIVEINGIAVRLRTIVVAPPNGRPLNRETLRRTWWVHPNNACRMFMRFGIMEAWSGAGMGYKARLGARRWCARFDERGTKAELQFQCQEMFPWVRERCNVQEEVEHTTDVRFWHTSNPRYHNNNLLDWMCLQELSTPDWMCLLELPTLRVLKTWTSTDKHFDL